jgi:hypothetical protein
MPPGSEDQREYLIAQIAKCLRLAGAIAESKTAEVLLAIASDYQRKLDQLQGRQS